MDPAEAPARITVTVAYSPAPRQVDLTSVNLEPPATVLDAITASGLLQRYPDIDPAVSSVGVWGKLRALHDELREGDRVEVYRPLTVDPKEARRLRYRNHREKFKAAR